MPPEIPSSQNTEITRDNKESTEELKKQETIPTQERYTGLRYFSDDELSKKVDTIIGASLNGRTKEEFAVFLRDNPIKKAELQMELEDEPEKLEKILQD